MRHSLKRKSIPEPQGSNEDTPKAPARKVFKALDFNQQPKINHEDVKAHLTELNKESKKPCDKRNNSHIKSLLKETLEFRQKLLRQHPDGGIQAIFEAFPCFDDSSLVSFYISRFNILLKSSPQ